MPFYIFNRAYTFFPRGVVTNFVRSSHGVRWMFSIQHKANFRLQTRQFPSTTSFQTNAWAVRLTFCWQMFCCIVGKPTDTYTHTLTYVHTCIYIPNRHGQHCTNEQKSNMYTIINEWRNKISYLREIIRKRFGYLFEQSVLRLEIFRLSWNDANRNRDADIEWESVAFCPVGKCCSSHTSRSMQTFAKYLWVKTKQATIPQQWNRDKNECAMNFWHSQMPMNTFFTILSKMTI